MPILLSSFYFFYFAVVGVYIIFMPKVLAMSGYSASDIGILFAAGPLVRFLLPFAFVKGLKIDLKIFNIALLFILVSAFSFYYSINNFYQLLLSNIGIGMGLSVVLPYIEVISLHTMGKERYGKIRLFGSVGFVLVALVLVTFLRSPEIALNYLVIASILTVFTAFIIAKTIHAKKEKKEEEIINDINLLHDWRLWAGLTLMQVSFGSFYNFFTIYETDFGLSLDMTIYLWSFGVVAEIFMLFSQGRFLKNNLLTILQITTFVSAFRWFLVYLFPQNLVILFFAQSLHALSFALFHSAAITYLYNTYKHRALAQQFFSGITYGLGGLSGALLAGYIYEYYPRELFLSSSIIALLACGFIYLHAKKSSNP
ncbi:MFS transporter [Sulfurimonas sp. SAG-AH-194-I05]|nr:MFS transporter [Sulfurimonas sp. SAG-AH-194-I05]MDF1875259.1 MFS transporter [Sulfurimonas sp. SAG-AH-194-I05]